MNAPLSALLSAALLFALLASPFRFAASQVGLPSGGDFQLEASGSLTLDATLRQLFAEGGVIIRGQSSEGQADSPAPSTGDGAETALFVAERATLSYEETQSDGLRYTYLALEGQVYMDYAGVSAQSEQMTVTLEGRVVEITGPLVLFESDAGRLEVAGPIYLAGDAGRLSLSAPFELDSGDALITGQALDAAFLLDEESGDLDSLIGFQVRGPVVYNDGTRYLEAGALDYDAALQQYDFTDGVSGSDGEGRLLAQRVRYNAESDDMEILSGDD